jgi:phytol kinase
MNGVAIVLAAFGALLLTAELWSRLGNPKPEWTRKLVHLGGGIIGLFLPWLIESALVVFILTASLSALFVIGEKTGLLKSVHGVARKSRGSEYYPLAIWLVFVIAADQPAFYLAGVLVLALADAFAALIGSRYGAVRYEVEDEFKSVEGSVVFFFVAFMAIHLPLLLMTGLPRAVCVLSALLVAMLVTLFEAISLEGTDNLFVPLAVVFVLQKITTKTVEHIALQNVAFVCIVAVVLLLAWRIEWFNAGGAIAVTLFVFAAWSLGDHYRYVIPVFIGLFGLALVRIFVIRRGDRRRLKVRAVTRALIVPFVFLLAANMSGLFDVFFAPYLAACAAVFAFVAWTGGRAVKALAVGVGAAVLLVAPMRVGWEVSAIVIAVVGVMAVANARFADPREWGAASFLFALLAGMVVFAIHTVIV